MSNVQLALMNIRSFQRLRMFHYWEYIDTVNKEKGKFEIFGTFSIAGRGIVFVGTVLQGSISLGDFIRFSFNKTTFTKRVIGIDSEMRVPENIPKTGIVLECEDKKEIEKLRNWNPNLTVGTII